MRWRASRTALLSPPSASAPWAGTVSGPVVPSAAVSGACAPEAPWMVIPVSCCEVLPLLNTRGGDGGRALTARFGDDEGVLDLDGSDRGGDVVGLDLERLCVTPCPTGGG